MEMIKQEWIQLTLSGIALLYEVEVITWIVLAFWGIRLCAKVLRKEAERRSIW